MAEFKAASATFDAFKKAFAAGDGAKTASLLGTLKASAGTWHALY
jgi:hypothetical protein